MQPRWQKAQLKDDPDIHPFIRGKEVWLKIGSPQILEATDWLGREGSEECYECNLLVSNNNLACLSKRSVLDLLPEFAEDVEILPWAVWSKIE